jgi:uncharacterized protein YcbK (DUF882 family)
MTRRLFAVAVGIAIALSAATVEAKPRQAKHSAKAHHSHQYKKLRHGSARKAHRHVRQGRGRVTADRGCLVPAARALLARIESQFGPVQVISTCRAGAVIAGSGRPSLHRYGMAFDFRSANKSAVVRWLAANNSGGTMTYRHSDHIHADVGRHFVALGSGGGSRRAQGRRYASRAYASNSVVAEQNAGAAAQSAFQDRVGFRTYGDDVTVGRVASRRHVRHSRHNTRDLNVF